MNLMAVDFHLNEVRPHFDEEEMILFRKKRILLVEEDWDFSQLLSNLLSQHLDIEVEVVKNTYQALGRMTHEPYDVIVLDSKVHPYQALLEAEQFLDPVLENHSPDTGKIPVIVLMEGAEESVQGLESHYFRIIAAVEKDPKLSSTLRAVEEELNEILEL